MYTALVLMLAGVLLGRAARSLLNARIVTKVLFGAVLLLLFLLGLQIGANNRLFANLPNLGGKAVAITAGALAGSLLCSRLLEGRLRRRGYFDGNSCGHSILRRPANSARGEKRRG